MTAPLYHIILGLFCYFFFEDLAQALDAFDDAVFRHAGVIHAEMVGIAAVRVERAARHVGNVLSQCLRHERFGIHAFRKRYPREETALRVCKGEAGREILFHAVVHQCTAFAVDITEFGNMFVDIEHIEEERNLALRKGRDLQVRCLFVLDGLVDNGRIGDHPGHAQTGHHDLREGAEEDDLAFLVQGFEGRQLFDVVAEFAVRVVFDDGEIVFSRTSMKALRRSRGQVMPVGFWNSGMT